MYYVLYIVSTTVLVPGLHSHTDTNTNRDSHRLSRKYMRRHKHGTKAVTNTWTQKTDTPQKHLQPFGIN